MLMIDCNEARFIIPKDSLDPNQIYWAKIDVTHKISVFTNIADGL